MRIQGCVEISTLIDAILHFLLIQYYTVYWYNIILFMLAARHHLYWWYGYSGALNHYIPGKQCDVPDFNRQLRCKMFLLSDSDMGPIKQQAFFSRSLTRSTHFLLKSRWQGFSRLNASVFSPSVVHSYASFTPNSFAVRSPKWCGTGSNCVRTEWTFWQLFGVFLRT